MTFISLKFLSYPYTVYITGKTTVEPQAWIWIFACDIAFYSVQCALLNLCAHTAANTRLYLLKKSKWIIIKLN